MCRNIFFHCAVNPNGIILKSRSSVLKFINLVYLVHTHTSVSVSIRYIGGGSMLDGWHAGMRGCRI